MPIAETEVIVNEIYDANAEEAQERDEVASEASLALYDITSSPNDFNVATIYDFIKRGVVKIPGFQRNYVWDLRRASQLIESILVGLPIPQIFLYEEARNSFLVIDGQQRLMSLYFFREGRFPRFEKRAELRRIYDQNAGIPEDVFNSNQYFEPFRLKLPARPDGVKNQYSGLDYETLGESRELLDLRTIRHVIIKQLQPKDGNSSIYEIFNRLNTKGVNLRPQEIRSSLYRSRFYEMLGRVNEMPGWRRLYGGEPDIHMQDIQSLLRAFAVLEWNDEYSPSMVRFLDRYSDAARKFDDARVVYLEDLFAAFIAACGTLDAAAFGVRGKPLSITVFEAVFHAACRGPYAAHAVPQGQIVPESLRELKQNAAFAEASLSRTTSKVNLSARLKIASQLVQLRAQH